MRALPPTLIVLLLLGGAGWAGWLLGCKGEASRPPAQEQTGASGADTALSGTAPAIVPPTLAPPVVLFLGDSLTAGFGLPADRAYPARVAARLGREGRPVRVVNAGVSGDTTAGGRRRLPWLLRQRPDVVVVALGANDGLRGTSVEAVEANLRDIVETSRRAGAEVLLVGMMVPPNLGPDYARGFADLYTRIAGDLGVSLVPFLLEGVGGVVSLNQEDGVHPTAEGQERLADNVLPALRTVLDRMAGGSHSHSIVPGGLLVTS